MSASLGQGKVGEPDPLAAEGTADGVDVAGYEGRGEPPRPGVTVGLGDRVGFGDRVGLGDRVGFGDRVGLGDDVGLGE
jgi:hypothetical protein